MSTPVACSTAKNWDNGTYCSISDGEVVGEAILTIDAVRDRCKEHVDKQQAGMMSLTMRTDTGSTLGKLLQTRTAAAATPTSKMFKETTKQIEDIDRRLRRRTPDDRHKQRMSALHVDPVSAEEWNRPAAKIPGRQAYEVLTDARND